MTRYQQSKVSNKQKWIYLALIFLEQLTSVGVLVEARDEWIPPEMLLVGGQQHDVMLDCATIEASSDGLISIVGEGDPTAWGVCVSASSLRGGGRLWNRNKKKHNVSLEATATIATEADTTSSTSVLPRDLDSLLGPQEHQYVTSKNNLVFTIYQDGDGSLKDPDGLPSRYLQIAHGDRVKALQMVQATIAFRKEYAINSILARPHPNYDLCKDIFPHMFLGRDKQGHAVLLQRPAKINVQKAKKHGISGQDLLMHYIYVMEYLWRIESPQADALMTSVIDVSGLNMSILKRKDLLDVLKLFMTTMDNHFPKRNHVTLLIGCPRWFHMVYQVVSPLLRQSTKEKIKLVSSKKKQDKILADYLGKGIHLPPHDDEEPEDAASASSSSSSSSGSGYPMEDKLRQFVLDGLSRAGMKMNPV